MPCMFACNLLHASLWPEQASIWRAPDKHAHSITGHSIGSRSRSLAREAFWYLVAITCVCKSSELHAAPTCTLPLRLLECSRFSKMPMRLSTCR